MLSSSTEYIVDNLRITDTAACTKCYSSIQNNVPTNVWQHNECGQPLSLNYHGCQLVPIGCKLEWEVTKAEYSNKGHTPNKVPRCPLSKKSLSYNHVHSQSAPALHTSTSAQSAPAQATTECSKCRYALLQLASQYYGGSEHIAYSECIIASY